METIKLNMFRSDLDMINEYILRMDEFEYGSSDVVVMKDESLFPGVFASPKDDVVIVELVVESLYTLFSLGKSIGLTEYLDRLENKQL